MHCCYYSNNIHRNKLYIHYNYNNKFELEWNLWIGPRVQNSSINQRWKALIITTPSKNANTVGYDSSESIYFPIMLIQLIRMHANWSS